MCFVRTDLAGLSRDFHSILTQVTTYPYTSSHPNINHMSLSWCTIPWYVCMKMVWWNRKKDHRGTGGFRWKTTPRKCAMKWVLCMFVCINRSPGWEIWLNYEVVEFQASVRDLYILRICRWSLTTFIHPARPTWISCFLDHTILSSSYCPSIGSIQRRLTVIFIATAPHILSRHGTSSTWNSHPHSTLHPHASAACLCSPHHVPASAAMSRICSPPLATLSLCPG